MLFLVDDSLVLIIEAVLFQDGLKDFLLVFKEVLAFTELAAREEGLPAVRSAARTELFVSRFP